MSEGIRKKINDHNDDKGKPNRDYSRTMPANRPNYRSKKEEEEMGLWGIFLFGLIGATATTLAVGHMRQTADWFYSQMTRSGSSWKGTNARSFRSGFQEEAWKRYNRRLQEEYEEEMERVERIRRMQSVFNREKNKHRRGYESWRENNNNNNNNNNNTDGYHQHFQREDWYWKTNTSNWNRTNFNYKEAPRAAPANYSLSHHYAVLGLSRSRTTPYTDDEIKTAFRSKAKQYHPDQNQQNKEVAEARFKEVMTSYEAIKSERKNAK